MKRTKDNEMSHDSTKSDAGAKAEKLSRREFAKTSVAAGAVAATIPGVLQAAQQSSDPSAATPESPNGSASSCLQAALFHTPSLNSSSSFNVARGPSDLALWKTDWLIAGPFPRPVKHGCARDGA